MNQSHLISTIVFLFVISIVIAGCSSQVLVPIRDDGYSDRNARSVTKSQNGVEITVLPSIWEANPYYLKEYITPVYVEIKNNNAEAISFDYRETALITADGVQKNPLSPENAAGIISASGNNRQRPVIIVSSFSFGYSKFHRYSRFGFHGHHHPFHDPFYYEGYYPAREVNTSDIFSKAITTGSVRPGAKLIGFVYFPKLADDTGIVNFQISFKPENSKDKFEIEFPFAVLLTKN